jgi:dihydrofolate reductase
MDGVYQAPGGQDEDREGGFEHGGWSATYWDEAMGERITALTIASSAVLLGRKTYEIFANYWPNAGEEEAEIAGFLNSVPKYVASGTLDKVDWINTTLLEGDVADAVAKLKSEYETIGVTGSGNLIQTLLQNDLVDVLDLWVFPVVVGSGKRLFGDGAIPRAFRVLDSAVSSTGVAMMSYERAGAIEYGQIGG